MSLIYPPESLKAHPLNASPDYRSTLKRAPSQPLILLPHTLSETTGPVFGHVAVRRGRFRPDPPA